MRNLTEISLETDALIRDRQRNALIDNFSQLRKRNEQHFDRLHERITEEGTDNELTKPERAISAKLYTSEDPIKEHIRADLELEGGWTVVYTIYRWGLGSVLVGISEDKKTLVDPTDLGYNSAEQQYYSEEYCGRVGSVVEFIEGKLG